MQNYDNWLPMAEVRQRTGMSERTIYRLVETGKLHQARRPIPGRKPLPVYDPDTVAELENLALKARPHVMHPSISQELSLARETARETGLAEALNHLAECQTLAELARKTYLKIDEARALTGLSVEQIQMAAREGRVKRLGRVYRRVDLESL
jgi:hypothetical protein